MKSRQVLFFLFWPIENVQFLINSIGHLGWLSCFSNFLRFHKNVNSLELWKYISENSSPKGSFWRNKRKSEFSSLSADSRYLLAVAINCTVFKPSETLIWNGKQNTLTGPVIIRSFEKRAPGVSSEGLGLIWLLLVNTNNINYYTGISNSFLIGWKRKVICRNQRPWGHNCRIYNNHVKYTQGHG